MYTLDYDDTINSEDIEILQNCFLRELKYMSFRYFWPEMYFRFIDHCFIYHFFFLIDRK